MRAFSSVVSVALHVGLGLAVLFGSARTGRSNPRAPDTISMVFPQPAPRTTTSGIWAPSGPPTVVNDVGTIRVPNFTLQTGARAPAPFPAGPAPFSTATVSGSAPGWVAVGSENGPEALPATLFRPAFVFGRLVRVRVRIPYEFTIRNGMGPAH